MTTAQIIRGWIREYLREKQNRHAFFASAALFFLVIVGWGYWRHSRLQNESAQQAYAEAFSLYERFLAHEESADWQLLEQAATVGARDYGATALGPFFLALQSEALVRLNRLPEAVVLLDTALSKMSKKSSLYALYLLKKALMEIDSAEDSVQQAGYATLISLASDEKNIHRDSALFYAGYVAWLHDDQDKAREFFERLKAAFPMSPWILVARERQYIE